MANKPKSIFQLLSCITDKKTPWEKLTEADRKNFSVYMINRFLSMDKDLLFLVNYLQQFNMAGMEPREAYKIYLDLLPKQRSWSKYIKSTEKGDKLNKDLVSLFSEYFMWSRDECEENLRYILTLQSGKGMIKEQLLKFGYEPKQYGIK